ncbi:MAG: SsrA-binding protein SmpB [Dehalococcoidia bacterium]|tara:strand:- start:335 stop:775 length:441 start_codon:yes stop_codon:yes gene_type:complete
MTTNRKAYFNYHIEDSLRAGIVLRGSEIKSIRDGKIDISQAFCRIQNQEIWLHNAHIAPYENASIQSDHDPLRSKKLLLKKKEIIKWDLEVKRKNFIIVPLNLVITKGKAKIKIGLGKSKRKFDKRSVIKNREAQRDIDKTRKANR